MTRVAITVAVLLVVARTGIAATRSVGVSPATLRVASVQNGCSPLADPKRLPAADALVDSAALVAGLPTGTETDPTDFLVSVRLGGSNGAFFVDSTLTHSKGAEIIEHVLASVREGARVQMAHFRLRILEGTPTIVTVERSILCAPVGPPGGFERIRVTTKTVVTTQGSSPPPAPTRLRPVTPRLRISADGAVRQVDLGTGTGDLSVDRRMQDAYRRVRFSPALLDGRPIEVWLTGTRVEIAR